MQSQPAPVQSGIAPQQNRGRLSGIDSIRAISALVVVVGHMSLFSEATLHHPGLLRQLARLSAASWNGPAAVIVFFIISGFCIHLPFRSGRKVELVPFWLRRFLRVGLPSAVALAIAVYVLGDVNPLLYVIWSILCEMIYYALYPALLLIAGKIGWARMVVASYILSVVLSLAQLHQLVAEENAYTALGSGQTWLIGLPCWLLGCWLAENIDRFQNVSLSRLWLYRIGIILLSVALRIVKFHVHGPLASNCLTLNLFAFPACAWIGCEIAHFKQIHAPKILEWAGQWSYSLYLMHPLTLLILAALHLALLSRFVDHAHLLVIACALIFAYLFHLLVERPSHILAVHAGRFFTRKRASVPVAG